LDRIHESSFLMILPLILLGLGSIFIGFITKDFFIGLGTDFWRTSVFILPNNIFFVEAEFLPINLKWLPFILSTCGIILASIINIFNLTTFQSKKINMVLVFFSFLVNKKWYIDILHNWLVVSWVLNFGYLVSFKTLDRGFIELVGPYGTSRLIQNQSFNLTTLQTGQITHYLFFMVLGLCLFFFSILLSFSIFTFILDYRLLMLFITLIIFV
jgi:NADH-ubiquinone oxidoreductase chain 5